MLTLKNEIENWRELVKSDTDHERDALADELRRNVLKKLDRAGVEYQTTHKPQRVGAFVVVQDGTAEEREAFNAALDEALAALSA